MEIFTANKPRLILTYICKKHFGKTIGVLYHTVIDAFENKIKTNLHFLSVMITILK